ncbi:hypothetical protein D3C72_2130160 [compost metagenome]
MVEIDLAFLGQSHASRRPVDQTHPQMRFKLRYILADGGWRKAKHTGCFCKAAQFRHRPKDLQRRKAVHLIMLRGIRVSF